MQEDEPRHRQPLLHPAVVTQWLTRHAVSSHRNSPRVAIGIGRCTNKLKLDIHNFDIHETPQSRPLPDRWRRVSQDWEVYIADDEKMVTSN